MNSDDEEDADEQADSPGDIDISHPGLDFNGEAGTHEDGEDNPMITSRAMGTSNSLG